MQIYIKEGVEFRSAQKHVAKENFETVKPKIKEILGACRRISNKTRIETTMLITTSHAVYNINS